MRGLTRDPECCPEELSSLLSLHQRTGPHFVNEIVCLSAMILSILVKLLEFQNICP